MQCNYIVAVIAALLLPKLHQLSGREMEIFLQNKMLHSRNKFCCGSAAPFSLQHVEYRKYSNLTATYQADIAVDIVEQKLCEDNAIQIRKCS